jgi:hypothetical protein
MGRQGTRVRLALSLAACAALAWPASGSAATSNTITIGASTPQEANCWPFGGFLGDGGWGPNFAFVYQNIPPFQLRSGDVVAFDTFLVNQSDIRLDVAMARTDTSGSDVNAQPFTTVASSAQAPANSRGNATAGDYELQWTASAAFDFPGGGLLIRFSNPAGPFATETDCDENLVGAANSTDASGFFVGRRYLDADGVSPWDGGDDSSIGQFRLTLVPTSNSFTFGKVTRNRKKGTAQIPVTLPGPGSLALSGKGVKARTATNAHTSVAAAGTYKLTVKPKGKVRKKLLARGKAKVRISVIFAPNGDAHHAAGDPRTQQVKLKLIRRR